MKKFRDVPEIRFEGFTEAWEQRKLGEYLEVSKKKNKDEIYYKDDVLSVSGDYGIVNQIEFQGRSFAGASVVNYGVVEKGDVVYTKSPLKSNPYGIIKTNQGKTGIVSTLYAVYKPLENTHPEFMEIYFEHDARMNNYMHPLINKGAKNDMKVSDENALKGAVIFPEKQEQEEISKYFSSLDHLITLHKSKHEKLLDFKESMLYKLFPKEGETIPEMRFEGFSGVWEKSRLGDCFSERIESFPEGELLSVTINNGIKKFSDLDRINNSNENKTKYKKVYVGDIAYNSMRMWQGASGYSLFEGIVSPAYTVLRANEGIDARCFSYLFKRSDIIHMFQIHSKGITSDNWNLKYTDFKELEVYVSQNYEEQKAIGEYFSNLDQLIQLSKDKVEKLKNIKSSLLDKMFV